MGIKSDLPQIAALRNKVEEKAGHPMSTHSNFVDLAFDVEEQLSEHMSETTLERLWGYSTRHYETVSVRTLDVLARYVGAGCWADFREQVNEAAGVESEFVGGKMVKVSELAAGDLVRLGWLPDRICVVRHLGDGRFEVVEVENASIRVGDRFVCQSFQIGRPVYMDSFERADGASCECYVAGKKNGLTTLEIIE